MRPPRLRPLALLCGGLSLFSVYCHRFAGGDVGNVATPHADGYGPCNNNVQCASFACVGGVCAPPEPGQVEIDGDCGGGEPCVGDARCDNGICVATKAACAADNTPCLADEDCCNFNCSGDVCGFGGTDTGTGTSTCAKVDDFCVLAEECCSGYCDTQNDVCTSSCVLGDSGSDCNSGADCCSGHCDFSVYQCE